MTPKTVRPWTQLNCLLIADAGLSFLLFTLVFLLLFLLLSAVMMIIWGTGIPAKVEKKKKNQRIFSTFSEIHFSKSIFLQIIFIICLLLYKIKNIVETYVDIFNINSSWSTDKTLVFSNLSLFFFFFLFSLSWLRSRLRWRLLLEWRDSDDADLLSSNRRLTSKQQYLEIRMIFIQETNHQETRGHTVSCTCETSVQISLTPPRPLPLPVATVWRAPLNEHLLPLWSPAGWLQQCQIFSWFLNLY